MNLNKTVSLSQEAIRWVEKQGENFSKCTDKIILEHRGVYSKIKRQEALDGLRAAAVFLAQNEDVPQEAIVAWVKAVTAPSPAPTPPKA